MVIIIIFVFLGLKKQQNKNEFADCFSDLIYLRTC